MADISKITIESGTYDIKDSTARNNISTLENNINTLNNNIISKMTNSKKPSNMNKVIFIGDSYGGLVAQTTWIDILINKLNLTSEEYYRNDEASTGFCNYNITTNNRFINLLQNLTANIPSDDKTNITHIIVCGGANDMKSTYTISDITGRINDFITYAAENYINAKVYIGMIGFTTDPSLKRYLGRVLEGYSKCINYGGIYLNGVENAIHDYAYFGTSPSDTVHPNQNGSTAIGNALYEALIRGYVEIHRDWTTVADNVGYNGLLCYSHNGDYKLRLNNFSRITKQTASLVLSPSNPIYLMDYTTGCTGGIDGSLFNNSTQYTLYAQFNDATTAPINGYLGTESYIHNDTDIRQRVVFYPCEIDTSSGGSGGYKVLTNIYGFYITPVQLNFTIYDC